jgi:hypothetical protein
MLRESRQSDPQAIAAKVRHLVSSAGLRLIEFSLRRKSAPSFIEASCGSLPSHLRGSWVSERAEAKENRKIPWERSSFTADASTRVDWRQRNTGKKAQSLGRREETSSVENCGKSFQAMTILQGLVPGIPMHTRFLRLLVVGFARVSDAEEFCPWATSLL